MDLHDTWCASWDGGCFASCNVAGRARARYLKGERGLLTSVELDRALPARARDHEGAVHSLLRLNVELPAVVGRGPHDVEACSRLVRHIKVIDAGAWVLRRLGCQHDACAGVQGERPPLLQRQLRHFHLRLCVDVSG